MRSDSDIRKVLVVMLLAVVSVACSAKKDSGKVRHDVDAVRQEKLLELIGEYSDKDDFAVIQIGSFGTSAIKALVRAAASVEDDGELKDAMEIIKGIRKVSVVEYGSCMDDVRETFEKRLDKLLDGCDMLAEVKDGEDKMRMYGVVDEDSDDVKDFILYSRSDCTLVCLFGSISLNAVAKIVAE